MDDEQKGRRARRQGRRRGYKEKIRRGPEGFYMHPSPKFLFWRIPRPQKTLGHVDYV